MGSLAIASRCLRACIDRSEAAPTVAIMPGDLDALSLDRAEPFVKFGAADIERSRGGQVIKNYTVNLPEREARNIAQIVGVKQEAREFRSRQRRVDQFE